MEKSQITEAGIKLKSAGFRLISLLVATLIFTILNILEIKGIISTSHTWVYDLVMSILFLVCIFQIYINILNAGKCLMSSAVEERITILENKFLQIEKKSESISEEIVYSEESVHNLFKKALAIQQTGKELDKAISIYNYIIQTSPSSEEASKAKINIERITNYQAK